MSTTQMKTQLILLLICYTSIVHTQAPYPVLVAYAKNSTSQACDDTTASQAITYLPGNCRSFGNSYITYYCSNGDFFSKVCTSPTCISGCNAPAKLSGKQCDSWSGTNYFCSNSLFNLSSNSLYSINYADSGCGGSPQSFTSYGLNGQALSNGKDNYLSLCTQGVPTLYRCIDGKCTASKLDSCCTSTSCRTDSADFKCPPYKGPKTNKSVQLKHTFPLILAAMFISI